MVCDFSYLMLTVVFRPIEMFFDSLVRRLPHSSGDHSAQESCANETEFKCRYRAFDAPGSYSHADAVHSGA